MAKGVMSGDVELPVAVRAANNAQQARVRKVACKPLACGLTNARRLCLQAGGLGGGAFRALKWPRFRTAMPVW